MIYQLSIVREDFTDDGYKTKRTIRGSLRYTGRTETFFLLFNRNCWWGAGSRVGSGTQGGGEVGRYHGV